MMGQGTVFPKSDSLLECNYVGNYRRHCLRNIAKTILNSSSYTLKSFSGSAAMFCAVWYAN